MKKAIQGYILIVLAYHSSLPKAQKKYIIEMQINHGGSYNNIYQMDLYILYSSR